MKELIKLNENGGNYGGRFVEYGAVIRKNTDGKVVKVWVERIGRCFDGPSSRNERQAAFLVESSAEIVGVERIESSIMRKSLQHWGVSDDVLSAIYG